MEHALAANFMHLPGGPCIMQSCCMQVLRKAAPSCHQLPQEEVWTHKPAATKEEDQIDVCWMCCSASVS